MNKCYYTVIKSAPKASASRWNQAIMHKGELLKGCVWLIRKIQLFMEFCMFNTKIARVCYVDNH